MARADAERLIRKLGSEVRQARRAAGLSVRAAGAAVGMDPSSLARLERGEIRGLSVERLAIACSAVGLRVAAQAYPAGDPVRDAGHLRLLGRIRNRLPVGAPWMTEMPIQLPGDRRAIDATTVLHGRRVIFEAEMRLEDIQALQRRLSLKIRDAGDVVAILVVAETHHNRAVLQAHREALRPLFPLDPRAVLLALASGRGPSANGVAVL